MSTITTHGIAAGPNPYIPQTGGPDLEDAQSVRLLRRLQDGVHVVVWSVRLDCPMAAKTLYVWMTSKPENWVFWGRLAVRLGPDTVTPVILAAAMADEAARIATERERRDEEDEQIRLSRVIDLYNIDPKGGSPALGLQRGNSKHVFFKMKFTEKWERDRVCDWLKLQRHRFAEMAELFDESGEDGSIILERHILAGMRETERDVKARGLAASGRRPLRFWRGE